MTEIQANSFRRLNIILRLAHDDLRLLNDEGWQKLRDDLFFAVLNQKKRVPKDDAFHRAATREGISAAQDGLRAEITSLRYDQTEPARFQQEKQILYIAGTQNGFTVAHETTNFPTMLYGTLGYLLERTGIKPADIRGCDNVKCRALFVPLRKPRSGTNCFCSPRCANRIAAREYRKRTALKTKEKERERSHKKYEAKVQKKYYPSKVQVKRIPRKSKA